MSSNSRRGGAATNIPVIDLVPLLRLGGGAMNITKYPAPGMVCFVWKIDGSHRLRVKFRIDRETYLGNLIPHWEDHVHRSGLDSTVSFEFELCHEGRKMKKYDRVCEGYAVLVTGQVRIVNATATFASRLVQKYFKANRATATSTQANSLVSQVTVQQQEATTTTSTGEDTINTNSSSSSSSILRKNPKYTNTSTMASQATQDALYTSTSTRYREDKVAELLQYLSRPTQGICNEDTFNMILDALDKDIARKALEDILVDLYDLMFSNPKLSWQTKKRCRDRLKYERQNTIVPLLMQAKIDRAQEPTIRFQAVKKYHLPEQKQQQQQATKSKKTQRLAWDNSRNIWKYGVQRIRKYPYKSHKSIPVDQMKDGNYTSSFNKECQQQQPRVLPVPVPAAATAPVPIATVAVPIAVNKDQQYRGKALSGFEQTKGSSSSISSDDADDIIDFPLNDDASSTDDDDTLVYAPDAATATTAAQVPVPIAPVPVPVVEESNKPNIRSLAAVYEPGESPPKKKSCPSSRDTELQKKTPSTSCPESFASRRVESGSKVVASVHPESGQVSECIEHPSSSTSTNKQSSTSLVNGGGSSSARLGKIAMGEKKVTNKVPESLNTAPTQHRRKSVNDDSMPKPAGSKDSSLVPTNIQQQSKNTAALKEVDSLRKPQGATTKGDMGHSQSQRALSQPTTDADTNPPSAPNAEQDSMPIAVDTIVETKVASPASSVKSSATKEMPVNARESSEDGAAESKEGSKSSSSTPSLQDETSNDHTLGSAPDPATTTTDGGTTNGVTTSAKTNENVATAGSEDSDHFLNGDDDDALTGTTLEAETLVCDECKQKKELGKFSQGQAEAGCKGYYCRCALCIQNGIETEGHKTEKNWKNHEDKWSLDTFRHNMATDRVPKKTLVPTGKFQKRLSGHRKEFLKDKAAGKVPSHKTHGPYSRSDSQHGDMLIPRFIRRLRQELDGNGKWTGKWIVQYYRVTENDDGTEVFTLTEHAVTDAFLKNHLTEVAYRDLLLKVIQMDEVKNRKEAWVNINQVYFFSTYMDMSFFTYIGAAPDKGYVLLRTASGAEVLYGRAKAFFGTMKGARGQPLPDGLEDSVETRYNNKEPGLQEISGGAADKSVKGKYDFFNVKDYENHGHGDKNEDEEDKEENRIETPSQQEHGSYTCLIDSLLSAYALRKRAQGEALSKSTLMEYKKCLMATANPAFLDKPTYQDRILRKAGNLLKVTFEVVEDFNWKNNSRKDFALIFDLRGDNNHYVGSPCEDILIEPSLNWVVKFNEKNLQTIHNGEFDGRFAQVICMWTEKEKTQYYRDLPNKQLTACLIKDPEEAQRWKKETLFFCRHCEGYGAFTQERYRAWKHDVNNERAKCRTCVDEDEKKKDAENSRQAKKNKKKRKKNKNKKNLS